jgi:hypothetical protein
MSHTMKGYGDVEVKLHALFTLALDGVNVQNGAMNT